MLIYLVTSFALTSSHQFKTPYDIPLGMDVGMCYSCSFSSITRESLLTCSQHLIMQNTGTLFVGVIALVSFWFSGIL